MKIHFSVRALVCAAFKAVPEVSDLMLPMRDGVKRYTVVARPRGAGKCPVIITLCAEGVGR